MVISSWSPSLVCGCSRDAHARIPGGVRDGSEPCDRAEGARGAHQATPRPKAGWEPWWGARCHPWQEPRSHPCQEPSSCQIAPLERGGGRRRMWRGLPLRGWPCVPLRRRPGRLRAPPVRSANRHAPSHLVRMRCCTSVGASSSFATVAIGATSTPLAASDPHLGRRCQQLLH